LDLQEWQARGEIFLKKFLDSCAMQLISLFWGAWANALMCAFRRTPGTKIPEQIFCMNRFLESFMKIQKQLVAPEGR
jgi:hypothetical protein